MQSLSHEHTFGFATKAKEVLLIPSVETLQYYLDSIQTSSYLILGEGSNTIFLEDYTGCIFKIAIKGIDVKHTQDDFIISVGAGENWHTLVSWCLQKQIYGLENLALIPGTVGAAPIQNIGAYGLELAKFVKSVEYLDITTGGIKALGNLACNFGYRDSIFKRELMGKAVITKVVFKIPKNWQPITHYGELTALDNPTAQDIFNKVVEVRKAKLPDPKELGNAGSFFKNPIITVESYAALKTKWPTIPSYQVDDLTVKIPAAWLIDTLGFKGRKIGGISCHIHQPLVLTNDGTGTGKELLLLARQIRDKVQQEFSIVLENEVRLMGSDGAIIL
ncbi:UDP-N-acetylmuramate dehydrogenase [Paraglaciecola aquimarina]|uniref:UDP-N-acetylenolpyruvoylglucosamine reductase n=1 Tax=Paraglaciecola algarum TaxID=3050085 RepID=A0ABS9D434_9ALTE|nr:UDP-N-acetylmuramate dehydrogenase [Paraglaciecola sp. G1-23]MCF2947688.1 UDP-N-acetylmuramate dehydrogenase [Paraglaciecola sp. G1-23]